MTFSTGDFLGSWAVELAVHHLDLELIADPPAASALRLARRTVEDLTEVAVPEDWDDATVVLAGTGRVALSDAEAGRHPGLREAVPRPALRTLTPRRRALGRCAVGALRLVPATQPCCSA